MRAHFPLNFAGIEVASFEALYQLIRAVGERIREGDKCSRLAAVQMIEFAKLGGWVDENEAYALCNLLNRHPVWEPTA